MLKVKASEWRAYNGLQELRRIEKRDILATLPSNTVLQGNSQALAATMAQTVVRMDEAALIRAAQSGDPSAFEQLVRLYDQSVLRLALNLLRSPEDANDIYQEAFLRVFRNLHNFRFDCSFHTWLYRIVTNLCLDALRKRKVRREETTVVETADGLLDRMDTVEEGRAHGDPQRQLMSTQLKDRMQQVLAQLTPRERMVFELKHYQGLRLRAIGEMLGTSEEAAKNCLFRATQKMRAALGDFI
jgi:RNA polymerase sigma-70 factor (ECF subfamily)